MRLMQRLDTILFHAAPSRLRAVLMARQAEIHQVAARLQHALQDQLAAAQRISDYTEALPPLPEIPGTTVAEALPR